MKNLLCLEIDNVSNFQIGQIRQNTNVLIPLCFLFPLVFYTTYFLQGISAPAGNE